MHLRTIKTGKSNYQFQSADVVDGNGTSRVNSDNYYTGGGGTSDSNYAVSTFTSSDLSSNIYTFTHDLGRHVTVEVYDDNSNVVIPSIVSYVDGNTVTIDLTGLSVTGTWVAVAS